MIRLSIESPHTAEIRMCVSTETFPWWSSLLFSGKVPFVNLSFLNDGAEYDRRMQKCS